MTISRRRFLMRAAAAGCAPMIVPPSVLGRGGATPPNSRIAFGVIGLGPRSVDVLMPWFFSRDDVRITAVCDCWASRLERGRDVVNQQYGSSDCLATARFEDILARDDIDGVIVSTGERSQGPISMLAARAGKDIYSEKPHSLTVAEGRSLVRTMNRHGTVYQCGHQRRSVAGYRFQADVVRQGLIGRVHTVQMRTWNCHVAPPLPDGDPPEGLDWDTWLGPTPWHPFNPRRMQWKYFHDTGGGVMTDMGVHYTDIAQWALGRDTTGPFRFETAAEFAPNNAYEHPATSSLIATYPDGVRLILENRGSNKDRFIRFEGDEGWIQIDDHTMDVTARPLSILSRRRFTGGSFNDGGDHVGDLFDAMRTRRQATVSRPESAHRATTIAHIGNIAVRLGRPLRWDPLAERFVHDPEADRMLSRAMRPPWTA